ncbi:MAG TPA: glutathione S-transferase family protein [Candidatus Binataceae bacterium]|jgi:glutathione S-transferase|nr:glutathione S-transferase family protein [Candidatus Binataceae bacterium]
MKLYYFPSPNPQKVRFAQLELGMECEMVPVDLTRREQRTPEFLALNPFGRVPVLVDGDLTLWESHAILCYLGDKAGRMWPTTAAGRADALRWLFFLSTHISPPATDLVYNRIAKRLLGLEPDHDAIARGESALPEVLRVVEDRLAKSKWLLGDRFTLVECGFGPVLNVIEKAQFSLADFPNIRAYLEALRARPAWKATPKLPGL